MGRNNFVASDRGRYSLVPDRSKAGVQHPAQSITLGGDFFRRLRKFRESVKMLD
jgi:hypothetical protein